MAQGDRSGCKQVVGGAASIIGVLLSKRRTRFNRVAVNGHEHKAEENACQYNILWDQSREEDWQLFTSGDQIG
jgi:hypothetical protein